MNGVARILVTGARGFIGRAILHALLKETGKVSLHALRRGGSNQGPSFAEVTWHEADLLNHKSVEELISFIKPTHCIHAAWETTPPFYWSSPINRHWHDASLALAHAFVSQGGKRFISLGSVAEYEWASGRMVENVTPDQPATFYGECKRNFHSDLIDLGRKQDLSVAVARIFFVYGPFEHPTKLVASACNAVASNQPVAFGPLDLWRDYIHVADLGRGIAALLHSSLDGIVNVASGEPIRQSMIIRRIAELSGRSDLFHIGARARTADEPAILFADTEKIRSTGWRPYITLEEGLSHSLHWWRSGRLHAA